MSDEQRLQEMERVARMALEDHGIAADTYRCEAVYSGWMALEVGYWPNGGGTPQWTLRATQPHDFQTFHFPGELQFNGQITPLSLQIVRLLDGLMWDDRR